MSQAVKAPTVASRERRGAGEVFRSPPRIVVIRQNTFAAGTAGTSLTAGNSGGASGDAFNSVNIGSGGTLAFSAAQSYPPNGLSLLCQTTTANTSAAIWGSTIMPNQGVLYFRCYLFFPALTANSSRFFTATPVATGGARFIVTTAGKLQVQNGTGAQVTISTATIPLGAWFRVEGYAAGSATLGATEVKLFYPANAVSPIETNTGTSVNTLGQFGQAVWGPNTSTANQGPYYLAAIAISNQGYIGPISLPAPVYSLQSPVVARQPRLTSRTGWVSANLGAPVQSPTVGPPFRLPVQAPRAPVPQTFSKGRVRSLPGAPVSNPTKGAPVKPLAGPVRAVIPQTFSKGRVTTNPGAPVRNPTPGAMFRQFVRAVRAVIPQIFSKGRTARNPGAPVVHAGPPVYPLPGPVRSRLPQLQPRAGRTAGNAGAPVKNSTAGPVFRQAVHPIGNAYRAPGPVRYGRVMSLPGVPPPPPPPVAGVLTIAPAGAQTAVLTVTPAGAQAAVLTIAPAGLQAAVITVTGPGGRSQTWGPPAPATVQPSKPAQLGTSA